MSDPIIFDDARLATRDYLRDVLPSYARDVPVSINRPTRSSSASPSRAVWVRGGTPSRDTTVSASALVRLAIYGDDEGDAVRLGSIVEALLLHEATSDALLGFTPVSGPAPGTDPDTGDPFALVIIRARLRPRPLRKD
ncbi:tail terminator [Microbacterium phage Mabodamaca]|uniref:Tail terminator n=1 Tax=Microbacterium phage Mabodamaca TaxID=3078574 RepID=A0AA96NGS0_9CAUD|nr:tail terminator [Microbacterium phage Mabodamaca]